MHPRIVAKTKIKGFFPFPIGIRFLNKEPGDAPREAEISTVCLDGAHLEDPLGICDAETGYETMVFIGGCSLFSVYTEHFDTKRQAKAGHQRNVKRFLAGKLPLSIQLRYVAHEAEQC